MIRRLDHIGIAVRDLEAAVKTYSEGLGLTCTHRETVEEQKVRTAFLPVGETHVELLESTAPDGPIGKFVEKRGEGIHHLCFEVADIRKSLAACEAAGMTLIDREPRTGAHGKWVAFVHPRSTHGVLLELSQEKKST
jgi:methylmalonyl-CoA epimerase